MDILDIVLFKVALVDAVQALDVGIALSLERGPVEWCGLFDRETVGFGLVDGLGDGGGVPGYFLWDTSR